MVPTVIHLHSFRWTNADYTVAMQIILYEFHYKENTYVIACRKARKRKIYAQAKDSFHTFLTTFWPDFANFFLYVAYKRQFLGIKVDGMMELTRYVRCTYISDYFVS